MKNRTERIQIINETLQMCREDPFLAESVKQAIEGQRIYWEGEPIELGEPPYKEEAEVILSPKRSMEAASAYAGDKKVCVLNFASSVTPGGGVLRGTTAQEESICRISSLYPCIADQETAGEFYRRHHSRIAERTMGRENSDDCIFTPGVITFREDTFDCELLPREQWFKTDVITCAAPDQRDTFDGSGYHPSEEELQAKFDQRIRQILRTAAAHGAEVLILGAFGCGAFYNSPYVVARAFKSAIKDYLHYFQTIEFAVYTGSWESENYKAFSGIK